jgi:hypothetical protein
MQFPCLRVTTNLQHQVRREQYETHRNGLTTKVDGLYASQCTIHLERTLDEAYYPGLKADDRRETNHDQVISRTVRSLPSTGAFPIVIVPQLWLWKSADVVVSAYGFTKVPDEYDNRSNDQIYTGSESESSDIYGDHDEFPWNAYHDPDVQLGTHMAASIEAFGKDQVFGNIKYLPTLDLFESTVVSVLTEVKNYTQGPKRNTIEYDTEERFHHVLSDCRSELAMIQSILLQQQDILHRFLKVRDQERLDVDAQYRSAWSRIDNAREMLDQQYRRTQKIDGDAERIEKNVQDLLNLKRTYASVQDSHASVLLSTAAIGFAFVTIIFAPLAFLTALFALNLQGFDNLRVPQGSSDGASNGTPAYHSGKMAGIFGKYAFSPATQQQN